MKLKHVIASILLLALLFTCHYIPTFAAETTPSVTLIGTFSDEPIVLAPKADKKTFSSTVNIPKGEYQFYLTDTGTNLYHPGTVIDTTVKVSTNGWTFKDVVSTMCTLVATGGNYTFTYNSENAKVSITKDDLNISDETRSDLLLTAGSTTINANIGDKVSYDISLKTDKIFEDVQVIVSYNADKLKLVKAANASTDTCPNISDESYNSDDTGWVAINASNTDGYDFTNEMLFMTFDFEVIGTGKTDIQFTVQDMTVLGGKDSYYFYSTKRIDGANFKETLEADNKPVITETTTVPVTEKPIETTVPGPVVTEPKETTVPDPVVTEPKETTVPGTVSTEPVETTVPGTIPTTVTVATTSTEPTEASDTSPSTSTTEEETSAPVFSTSADSLFELGDVNRDGKLNIKDATTIQKYVAKLIDFDDEQEILADYESDGKINIKDTTRIQKKIAKLI